jgi:hypothetical protein
MEFWNFAKNLAQSTLASGYTAGNTTITVQTGDGAKFDAPLMVVAVGNPPAFFLRVTAGPPSSDTFTVDSTGFDGSTVSSVGAGAQITEVITFGVLQGLIGQINQLGTRANLPTATSQINGYTYRCTDGPFEFYFNGTSWVSRIFGYTVVEPVLANFSQVNISHSTLIGTYGGITMQITPISGDSVQQLTQSIPSPPYYIDAAFLLTCSNGGAAGNFGIGVGDGTKLSLITFGAEGATLTTVKRIQYNSSTSFNNNANGGTRQLTGPLIWLRIYDDGTNLNYYWSCDAITWELLIQEGRAAFLSPSLALFGGDNNGNNPSSSGHLVHFSVHT